MLISWRRVRRHHRASLSRLSSEQWEETHGHTRGTNGALGESLEARRREAPGMLGGPWRFSRGEAHPTLSLGVTSLRFSPPLSQIDRTKSRGRGDAALWCV